MRQWFLVSLVGITTFFGIAQAQLITAGTAKLMLFGGSNHDVYLGCLSCADLDAESIFNKFGKYGNSFSSTSVYNTYSLYANPYADTSLCNPYAQHPPVVVDEKGGFYGSISKNPYAKGAITLSSVQQWLAVVCK